MDPVLPGVWRLPDLPRPLFARAVLLAGLAAAVAAGCRHPAGEATFPGAPVVLISIDTLRSDHLPAYGYRGVATPGIDGLRRDSLLFERVYCHYPMTLPSHVSLLTGELPPVNGVRDNSGFPFDSSRHSYLPRLLRSAGYESGAVVSAAVLAGATGLAQGFDHYDDRLPQTAGLGAEAKRLGSESARAALDWVRGRAAAGRPFFLFLHLYEPHAPYGAPEPFASRYRTAPYDAEIAAADAAVGDFLEGLKHLAVYDRAVVVLLSDHGEGLGEHGEQQHGTFLYRSTLQVPLLLKLPGSRRGGGVVRAPAQLIDVVPTLLGLAGLPVPAGLTGTSLLDLAGEQGGGRLAPARGAVAGDRPIYAEALGPRLHYGWSELTSLIQGPLHLADGPEAELFDLLADPGETRNLLAARRRDLAAMRQALRGLYRPPAAPRPADQETARQLSALGYVAGSGALPAGPLPDPRARRGQLAKLDAALAAMQAARWEQAAGLLRQLLAEEPRMVDVQILLGRACEQLGRKEEAAASFRRAVTVSGQAPLVALIAAREMLQLGRADEARALAALGRGADRHLSAQVDISLALAANDLDAAQAALRRAGGSRAEPDLRGEVGIALAEAGRSKEALELLEPLVASHGAAVDPDLLDTTALALGETGRDREAATLLHRVLEADPGNARAHQLLGAMALQQGRAAEAQHHLELAVATNPKLAEAWNILGAARLQTAGPGPALLAWRKAVELSPDYWEALFNLGTTSAGLGNSAEARRALERFVAKAPPDLFGTEIARARALLQRMPG